MRASRPVTRPFTVSGDFARGVPADVLGGRLAVARGCPGCRRSTASGSRVDPVLIGRQVVRRGWVRWPGPGEWLLGDRWDERVAVRSGCRTGRRQPLAGG